MILDKRFDTIALISSSAYFAILAVYLIFVLTESIKSKKDKDTFNGLRIATLILPIIYFAKLGYNSVKVKNNLRSANDGRSIDTVQKTLLSIYFLLVLIILCLDITEGDKKQYIYALIYVSPLLIVASFFLSYEQWKANSPKYVVLLSFFLALLYYTSFYDFLIISNDVNTNNGSLTKVSNESIVIIQTIISFVLFFLFGYMAYKS